MMTKTNDTYNKLAKDMAQAATDLTAKTVADLSADEVEQVAGGYSEFEEAAWFKTGFASYEAKPVTLPLNWVYARAWQRCWAGMLRMSPSGNLIRKKMMGKKTDKYDKSAQATSDLTVKEVAELSADEVEQVVGSTSSVRSRAW
jgi:hypothetical protein